MAATLSIDSWSIQDRCQQCLCVTRLEVHRLEVEGVGVAWLCRVCQKRNVLIGENKLGRIPYYVQAHVRAPKVVVPVALPLPWWRRLLAWFRRQS
jgi:hypothetical protein